MITYLLAIASPTHGVPASCTTPAGLGNLKRPALPRGLVRHHRRRPILKWPYLLRHQARCRRRPRRPALLHALLLHGHGSSRLHDRFTAYFENNRNIARINRAYASRSQALRRLRTRCLGTHRERWPSRIRRPGTGRGRRHRHHHPHRRARVVSLHARSLDGRAQALLPRLRRHLWGVYGLRDAFNPVPTGSRPSTWD